ncbi:YopX family protein [Bacillus sp. RE35]|uniref:YopX family protein n=1 Tax=Bacillus sp. RE35 TaxID=3454626 RepID=UPI003F93EFEB
MREIKFRAWDKEKQFMFTPTQVEITQGENFAKWDKWRPMAWRDELPEEGAGGIGRALGDECELMQYTGLKDKNGKDIYEGDIIKSEDGIVSTIVYDEASFKSVWTHNDHVVNCILDNLFIRTLNPVVVGNIYENPELIKN